MQALVVFERADLSLAGTSEEAAQADKCVTTSTFG